MFPPPFPGGFPPPYFPQQGMPGMPPMPGMPGGGPQYINIDPKSVSDEDLDNPTLFRKTKLCSHFRDGFCEWGDRCKYAHGEHELRILPAELMQRVDRLRSERDAAGLGRAPPRAPAPLNLRPAEPPPQMLALPAPGQPDAASDAAAGPSGALPPPPPLGADVDEETRRRQTREALRKTRLCDLFMSTGSCNFGNRCNFAHGYEELRAPMGVGGGPPMPPQPPPGMDMFGGPPGPFMPPMMPPMGPMPPMMPPLGPMMPPMAGPGPSGMPPLSGGLPGQAPGGGGGKPEPTTFIDRVRAICGMLNIGNAARMLEEKPGARTAAVQAVRSGAAFRENPFADDVEGYLQAA